jgi:hypothetical protein
MKVKNNHKEFYTNFKENLIKSQKWPGKYMFKFILKSKKIKPDFFKKYFTNHHYYMSIKESSNNNYKSITIKSNMNSPEEIIDIYKDLSKIDGIIVL